jgi:hypothetical protein
MIAFPPAIANVTHNDQGCKAKVDNARIQSLSRLFTQLLRCFGTDATLRRNICWKHEKQH